MIHLLQNAVTASRQTVTEAERVSLLQDLATLLIEETHVILQDNQKDLDHMSKDDPKYDRLKLTAERIKDMANDVRNVACLPSPLGQTLYEHDIQPGLHLRKISVPLGVVCMIYEARPNVTLDAFTLCFKSGNACVLKGGKEAHHSNQAIMQVIHKALQQHAIDPNWATYLAIDRDQMGQLLTARLFIDVIIPRGSAGLIQYVREHATIPVIETGAGVVHAYIDADCDMDMARKVIVNAKTRRVSVCNALDCVLVHQDRLHDLPAIVQTLWEKGVTVYADDACFAILSPCHSRDLSSPRKRGPQTVLGMPLSFRSQGRPEVPAFAGMTEQLQKATPNLDGHEFLDYKLLIKCVGNIDQAIDYINTYGSKHSEIILSNNQTHIQMFQNAVDASTIYINASSAFTDGAQFGLGAEIGISTQKLHARGPMALAALTSTKYIATGSGHIRHSLNG